MAPPLVAKQYTLRGKDQSALHSLEGETKRFQYKVRGALSQYVNNGHFYTDFKKHMRKNVCQSSPSFCRCVSILSSKHARKGKTESKMFLFFIFLVLSPQVTWCGISTQNLKSRGFHSHVLITPSEYSFSNFENNRGINVPKKMVVSKGFRFYLEEP